MISYCKKQSNFQTFKTKSGDYYEERKILEACDSSLYVSSVTVIVYFTSSYYVDLFGSCLGEQVTSNTGVPVLHKVLVKSNLTISTILI